MDAFGHHCLANSDLRTPVSDRFKQPIGSGCHLSLISCNESKDDVGINELH